MPVKLEWLGYRTMEKLLRYVAPFSYNTSMSRIDRQTVRPTDGQNYYINIARQQQYADVRQKWLIDPVTLTFQPKPYQLYYIPRTSLNDLGSFIFELCCRHTNKQTDRRTQTSYSTPTDRVSLDNKKNKVIIITFAFLCCMDSWCYGVLKLT